MKWINVVVLALLLTACTISERAPTESDASEVDGRIVMSLEYRPLEILNVDWEEVLKDVLPKCEDWGYSGVQAFGRPIRACVSKSGLGCELWHVNATFQCTGMQFLQDN